MVLRASVLLVATSILKLQAPTLLLRAAILLLRPAIFLFQAPTLPLRATILVLRTPTSPLRTSIFFGTTRSGIAIRTPILPRRAPTLLPRTAILLARNINVVVPSNNFAAPSIIFEARYSSIAARGGKILPPGGTTCPPTPSGDGAEAGLLRRGGGGGRGSVGPGRWRWPPPPVRGTVHRLIVDEGSTAGFAAGDEHRIFETRQELGEGPLQAGGHVHRLEVALHLFRVEVAGVALGFLEPQAILTADIRQRHRKRTRSPWEDTRMMAATPSRAASQSASGAQGPRPASVAAARRHPARLRQGSWKVHRRGEFAETDHCHFRPPGAGAAVGRTAGRVRRAAPREQARQPARAPMERRRRGPGATG
jgi:hypothetical protein